MQDLNKSARAAGYEVKDDDPLDDVERIFVFDPFGNCLEFHQR